MLTGSFHRRCGKNPTRSRSPSQRPQKRGANDDHHPASRHRHHEQEAHAEEWRHDFVLAALASEQEGHEQNIKMSRKVAENQREILARMAAGVPIDIGLKPPTTDDLRTYFMGDSR
jgi:hypothetical protein